MLHAISTEWQIFKKKKFQGINKTTKYVQK